MFRSLGNSFSIYPELINSKLTFDKSFLFFIFPILILRLEFLFLKSRIKIAKAC